ncbi:LysM peptidoglycan-binding domain-containing protein [Vibrio paucivorans]
MSRLFHYLIPTLISTFVLVSNGAHAKPSNSELTVKHDAPKSYTVVKGDTLWDISALYLDSPWLWPRLWQINPEIDNPHLIYPGDKLTLIWRDGQPVLSLKPMVKLSPKVRVLDKQALPTVPEGLVLPYLKSDRLVDMEVLATSEKVLGASNGRKYLTSEDSLFISGYQTQQKWGIYRVAAEFKRDDKVMVALKRIASATLLNAEPEFTGLTVTNQQQEILVNDLALPETGIETLGLSTTFYPQPSPPNSQATILGALEGVEYVGQNQIVVIDKGTQDKLRQGSMFELYQQGSKVFKQGNEFSYQEERGAGELQLPDTPVGSLMVIRPYPFFSLALITDSKAPIDKNVTALSPESSQTSLSESPKDNQT